MAIWNKFFRRKSVDSVTSKTCLKRCLSLFDLVAIGVGSMIGSGIYIVAGITAKQQAGPSIVISFLLSAFIVLLVSACFTELAARLHKTGSTYLYLYLTIGELPAFIIGFGILVLGVFGGATNAHAWSFYLDSLFNGSISNFTETYLIHWQLGPPLASYPDVMAVIVIFFLTAVVALGVQCSSKFMGLFAVINVIVLLFITVCGFVYGRIDNWIGSQSLNHSQLIDSNSTVMFPNNSTWSELSFFPYGWTGTVQGAAACFWAYSGFEMISCAVEESRNPGRDIPVATVVTMLLVTLLYLGASSGLTLMIPYSLIDITAPLQSAFRHVGAIWGSWIVSVAPLCGFTTALVSATYGFVRTALAMTEDGLLFHWFGLINRCTQAPVLSVFVCGVLQAVVAFAFNIDELVGVSVNLMLLSYVAVCTCVIISRFQTTTTTTTTTNTTSTIYSDDGVDSFVSSRLAPSIDGEAGTNFTSDNQPLLVEHRLTDDSKANSDSQSKTIDMRTHTSYEPVVVATSGDDMGSLRRSTSSCMLQQRPKYVRFAACLMLIAMTTLAFITVYCLVQLEHGVWWSVIVVTVAAVIMLIALVFIAVHRQTLQRNVLQIPCVPLIPSVAAFFCILLLVSSSTTLGWICLAVVFLSAVVIYLTYSVRHSRLNVNKVASREQDVSLRLDSYASEHLLNDNIDVDDESI